MIGQLLRFGGVGGAATLVHVLIASLLHAGAGLVPMLANLAGFASAVLLSCIGHARWTFGAGFAGGGQALRFVFVALVGLATSSLKERLGHLRCQCRRQNRGTAFPT